MLRRAAVGLRVAIRARARNPIIMRRSMSLIPEFQDAWKEEALDHEFIKTVKELPETATEGSSNAQQRGSYLGNASDFIPEIKCRVRNETREQLKHLRETTNLVPCVLKGKLWKKGIEGDVKMMVTQYDIVNTYLLQGPRHFCTVHKLTFENNPEHSCYAFITDILWENGKEKVTHVEFVRFDPENAERRLVKIPVNYWNVSKAPGLKYNGWLNAHTRWISCFVDSLDFPLQMNVNLTGMEHGDTVFMKDIKPHPKLSIYRKEFKKLLCSVKKIPRGED